MGTRNICFHGEMRKNISRYPLLARPMVLGSCRNAEFSLSLKRNELKFI